MTRRPHFLALPAVIVASFLGNASAKLVLNGRIVNDQAHPIGLARIESDPGGVSATSDSAGNFSLEIPDGTVRTLPGSLAFAKITLSGDFLQFVIPPGQGPATALLFGIDGKLAAKRRLGEWPGRYRVSIREHFEIRAGMLYLLKIQVGTFTATFKYGSAGMPCCSYPDNPTARRGAVVPIQGLKVAAQVESTLKISSPGHFTRRVSYSAGSSDLGSIPLNRSDSASASHEPSLEVGLDSLFQKSITVSPGSDLPRLPDWARESALSLHSWRIEPDAHSDAFKSAGLTVRIDSSLYHPSDEFKPSVYARWDGDTTLFLLAGATEIRSSDLSLLFQFNLQELRTRTPLAKSGKQDLGAISLHLFLTRHSHPLDSASAFQAFRLECVSSDIRNRKAIVFAHGLNSNSSIWKGFYLPESKRLGFDVFMADYQSFHHISSNGYALRKRLNEMDSPKRMSQYDTLILVGHSMGGLVARKAIAVGAENGDAWVQSATKLIQFASPNEGAKDEFDPLILGIGGGFDLGGVLDLRHGYLNEADWQARSAYFTNRKSRVAFPASMKAFSTVSFKDEVVGTNSAFNINAFDELRLDRSAALYRHDYDFRYLTSVLQGDTVLRTFSFSNGEVVVKEEKPLFNPAQFHGMAYNSGAGQDLFTQWVSSGWTKTSGPSDNGNLFSMAYLEPNLFAGGQYGKLYRSKDAGETWEEVHSFPGAYPVRVIKVSGGKLFAGTGVGLYTSSDHGETWNRLATKLRKEAGGPWIPDTIGQLEFNVYDLIVDANLIYAGADGGIFHSADNGKTWEERNGGRYLPWCWALVKRGDAIYAGTNIGVLKSTDGATSWTDANEGISGGAEVRKFAVQGRAIFAASNLATYRLYPFENTWKLVRQGAVDALVTTVDAVYAGTRQDGITRSLNHGETWNVIGGGLPRYPHYYGVSSLANGGGYVFAGMVYMIGSPSRVWRIGE